MFIFSHTHMSFCWIFNYNAFPLPVEGWNLSLEADESWISHAVHYKPKAAVSPPTLLLKAILKWRERGMACRFCLFLLERSCIIESKQPTHLYFVHKLSFCSYCLFGLSINLVCSLNVLMWVKQRLSLLFLLCKYGMKHSPHILISHWPPELCGMACLIGGVIVGESCFVQWASVDNKFLHAVNKLHWSNWSSRRRWAILAN